MEKKFLDKQGLSELNKSLKDEFASKGDVPTKVSQLDNDSKFTTLIEAKNDIGLLLLQQYKAQQTPQNKTSLGAVYVERINRVTDNPCLIFTYLTQQLNGNTEYEALQIAIELKTRRAFTRTAEQSRLFSTKLEIKSATWSKWQEETNPIEEVPTKLSQLENDKNYVDITKVNELILQASGLKKEVHDTLPAQGKDNVLYLIKDSKGKENNIYLEYLWVDNKFELIGSTDVDLSQYVKKDELESKLDKSQLSDDIQTDDNNKVASSKAVNTVRKTLEDKINKQEESLLNSVNSSLRNMEGEIIDCATQAETKIKSIFIPKKLADLEEDKDHRTVTDLEKQKWNKTSKSATFVIANYDSSENSKAGADYVIQENESPCEIINSFIEKLPNYGGKIQLTEGNFVEKNDKSIELNKNNVTLEGYGQATQLKAKGQKRKNFIAINNSNIVLKNIYCIGNENIAISLFSNSRNCCVINVRVMTNGTAFSVNGQYHILLNCVGMSIMSNNTIMYITGGNHIIKNCICTALQDDSDAFNINEASKVICVDCIGEAMGGVLRGNSFRIDNSTDCKFMNCIGETSHFVGFLIYGSSYNSFINCTCTNTEDLPVFMISGNESTVSRGNVFNACRAVSNGKNSAPQFKLTEETSFNIVTSCVMQNKNVLDKGQSNTVNNNIVLT